MKKTLTHVVLFLIIFNMTGYAILKLASATGINNSIGGVELLILGVLCALAAWFLSSRVTRRIWQ